MSWRQSAGATRRTPIWFLVLAVFLGPLGLGTSMSSAATTPCGASCPCDEEAEHGEADDDCGAPEDAGHGDEAPADDCPSDCPDCSCGAGAMLAVVGLPLPAMQLSSGSFSTLALAETTALGDIAGVFRPPRSLV